VYALQALVLGILLLAATENGFAQTPPLNIFTNYLVTGDYVVGGWVENPNLFANGMATGTIAIPDCTQYQALGQPCPASVVPQGADIVAAYLYWATVEGNQTTFAGQQAFFNGYQIVGTVLGNPNSPTTWSAGGCTGNSQGSKTMRMYRADVRPYLPLDLNSGSPTFGALMTTGSVTVKIADSGSNGNTQPNALGATLVLIYRVLNPPVPLNAIVLYDGSFAPSNTSPTMSQTLAGFYEPAINPTAKITQIVANGQPNKGQQVFFGANQLSSLYGSNPPFPGIYGAWDNPTWTVSNFVHGGLPGSGFDTTETSSVSPSSTGSGCVNWGAIIFSTTVQDSDADGLPDIWEFGPNPGYTDAVSGNQIALPGANPNSKDLFIQVDYLAVRDVNNNVIHTHLPKQQALDTIGQAFTNQGINVHFDLPSGVYSTDHYVISTGAGGHEIPESSLMCTDGNGALCAFPNQPSVSWKAGLELVQNSNFQVGRSQSYRYVLSGHSMGEPRFYWGTVTTPLIANDFNDLAGVMTQLVSLVDVGNTATVTIKSPSLINGVAPQFPPLVVKPGDCTAKAPPSVCSDANNGRVTVSGSLTPAPFTPGTLPTAFPLNGTYTFSNAASGPPDGNGVITTTFQITTSGVPDGTYQFSCQAQTVPACVAEPQLGVSYLGPTTTSGHSDFGGGGDVAVTLGLWGADDPVGCQPDPNQPPGAQGYCNDQVGTLKVQTGTLMHELGHTLTLSHGGVYYNNPNAPSAPTYDMNCKPNFISVMSYLFQVRGFPDNPLGGFDYSGQLLPPLNESNSLVNGVPALSEKAGVGTDTLGLPAQHLTRWYSTPNAGNTKVGSLALAHCDGSPLAQGEAPSVRVDGTEAPGGTFSAPLDWNNDLIAGDDPIPSEDLNHNGMIDTPYSGFADWQTINPANPADSSAFQQINARSTGYGFSDGGGVQHLPGGGIQHLPGGGVDGDGGGVQRSPGGGVQHLPGGGVQHLPGGGEQNTETANSTVDPPTGLICTTPITVKGVTTPGCTLLSGTTFVEKGKAVPLNWTSPDFGQIRNYFIWRATGNFPTPQQVLANIAQFSQVGTVSGTPPSTFFIDKFNLKNNATYTYFVTAQNKFTANSGPSTPLVVNVQF